MHRSDISETPNAKDNASEASGNKQLFYQVEGLLFAATADHLSQCYRPVARDHTLTEDHFNSKLGISTGKAAGGSIPR